MQHAWAMDKFWKKFNKDGILRSTGKTAAERGGDTTENISMEQYFGRESRDKKTTHAREYLPVWLPSSKLIPARDKTRET